MIDFSKVPKTKPKFDSRSNGKDFAGGFCSLHDASAGDWAHVLTRRHSQKHKTTLDTMASGRLLLPYPHSLHRTL